MNLNSVDWFNAQKLLIKLVQVLSPLTLRTVPSSFFLNRRFITPQSYSHEDFFHERSPVQLLTKLQSVQKEIEEWVGGDFRPKKESVKSVSKENLPLVKQAKVLIQQVQEAIGKLSNSSFIQKPQEGPLLQTFNELKPKLDQIIREVTEQKPEESPSPSRYIPTPERKEILKRYSKVKITEEMISTPFTKSQSKQEALKITPKVEVKVIPPSMGPILFPLKRIIQKRKKKDPKDPSNQENKD